VSDSHLSTACVIVLSHCSADLLSSGFEQTSQTAELLNDTRTNWCLLYSLPPPFAASLYTQTVSHSSPVRRTPSAQLYSSLTTVKCWITTATWICVVAASAFSEWKGQEVLKNLSQRAVLFILVQLKRKYSNRSKNSFSSLEFVSSYTSEYDKYGVNLQKCAPDRFAATVEHSLHWLAEHILLRTVSVRSLVNDCNEPILKLPDNTDPMLCYKNS